MTGARLPLALRVALAWIAIWEPLAPADGRRTWRDQWRADLWHYAAWLTHQPITRAAVARRLLARASSAPLHALVLRARSWSLHMLLHDLRYAWRMTVRRPAFTAVAILILGLGIGANATIFSWVEATLLSPMPAVPDQRRIVSLRGTTANRPDMAFSYLNFVDLRAAKPAGLEDMIAFRGLAISLRAGGEPVRIWGQLVTANFFDFLRVGPALGRTFRPADATVLGKEPVAVISHALWQRQFHGDPEVIGRAVTLNGQPFTIVGVSAEGFRGSLVGVALDIFIPITMQPAVLGGDRLPHRSNSFLQVFARLSPGASMSQAQASTAVVAARLAAEYPANNEGRGIKVLPLWRDGASGLMLPVMALLTGVVGVVLLIACANLAGLLLTRAVGRRREVAVRLAVGASRARLVRQFLMETAFLATAGGLAGLAMSYWAAGLLSGFFPPAAVPLRFTANIGPGVLLLWILATCTTAALVGLVPAIRASHPDVAAALKDAATNATPRRGWMRQTLVVSQVALSLVLLACAALFARSLQEAQALDIGFSLRQGFIASLELAVNAYDSRRGIALYEELQRRLAAVPGVKAVCIASNLPLDLGQRNSMSVEIEGYQRPPDEEIVVSYARVGSGFFATMGIPIVKGRPLDERDAEGRERAVVINETMAARYFAGREAVGRTLEYGGRSARIVGVAKAGKYVSLNEEARNYLYLPIAQFFGPEVALVVRTESDPLAIVGAVRAEVRRLDPNLPVFDVRTIDEYLQFSRFLPRMASILLSAFGCLALLLAAVGLYSVIAFSVSQRTREIGVRMALGADRASVVVMVVRQGLVLTGLGVAIGALLTAGAVSAIGDQLIGVRASDPVSWGLTMAVLGGAALAACVFPALRAASLDPLAALRRD